MSQYKITKKRLAEIIKEEYESILAQEEKKPDFLDLDKDGNKKEPMEDAADDKEDGDDKEKDNKKDLSKVPPQLRKSMKRNPLTRSEILLKDNLGTFNEPIAASDRPDSWQRCGWTRIWR